MDSSTLVQKTDERNEGEETSPAAKGNMVPARSCSKDWEGTIFWRGPIRQLQLHSFLLRSNYDYQLNIHGNYDHGNRALVADLIMKPMQEPWSPTKGTESNQFNGFLMATIQGKRHGLTNSDYVDLVSCPLIRDSK